MKLTIPTHAYKLGDGGEGKKFHLLAELTTDLTFYGQTVCGRIAYCDNNPPVLIAQIDAKDLCEHCRGALIVEN